MFPDLTLREQLVRVAEVYAGSKDLSLARISHIVLKGGHVLPRLAAGESDITTGNFEKALLWFSANWPADLAWPEGVRRPAASEAA